jgi:hypothetical protein
MPRSLRTPSNPSRNFDYEPFDQPGDDYYSKHLCEKNWHALETRIERFAQSGVCLVLALLIFRLICRFPFCSILLRSQSLQCIILSSQGIVAHAQLRAVKLVSVPRFENPRIYPDTYKSEHRQNDADLLPTFNLIRICALTRAVARESYLLRYEKTTERVSGKGLRFTWVSRSFDAALNLRAPQMT